MARKIIDKHTLIEKYLARIPSDIRDLLRPDPDQLAEFAVAIKRLRVKEEERYYVREIQRRYGVPTRPNESVKRTMIRVRLALLKQRQLGEETEEVVRATDPLPVDPLE
jgi:hypothetical protein